MSNVAIHQAHFLPWIPYFSLISTVDKFIVLDDVQYKPRYFINRTKIINKDTGDLIWVSIPTIGTQSTKAKDVVVVRDKCFYSAINKVRHNYQHFRYYEYWSEIESILCDEDARYLLDLNVRLLKCILKLIVVNVPEIYFSSQILEELPRCRTHRYELICRATSSSKILSGVGMAKDVHDIERLAKQGVKFQGMVEGAIDKHSIKTGLSIVDFLLSKGPDKTGRMIEDFSQSAFELRGSC